MLATFGAWPSGKATDFESVYRRFESYRPSSGVGLAGLVEGEVMPDFVTPVTWLEAPAWLTVPEAARLAG